jgi:hypothetical protein
MIVESAGKMKEFYEQARMLALGADAVLIGRLLTDDAPSSNL